MSLFSRIGLITSRHIPHLTADDQFLVTALAARGVTALPVVWDDPQVDWATFQMAIFRSTWDYFHHYDTFLQWLDATAGTVPLWNPPPLVRWNSHKHYLLDLAEQHIPVVPTLILPQGYDADLRVILEKQAWSRVVIKPAVGGGSFGTRFVNAMTLHQGQAHLSELLPKRDMLIQPYMEAVATYGERSLMFVDGKYSHAARKDPALRPDAPEGKDTGQIQLVEATREELDLAQRVLACMTVPWLYARVDTILGPQGHPMLMELEVIEPSLFFRLAPATADRLAEAICRRLQS